EPVDLLGVLGGERLQGPAAPRLFGDGVDVEAGRGHGLADDVLVAELLALVVAGGQGGGGEAGEALGEEVPPREDGQRGGGAGVPDPRPERAPRRRTPHGGASL